MSNRNIKVVIVDGAILVRQMIGQLLTTDAGFEVTTLGDASLALERMRGRWPDVLIVDVETPSLNGLAFVRQVMSERATPVLACSSLATPGSTANREALAAGAIGVIARPRVGERTFLDQLGPTIVRAVRAAARNGRSSAPPAPPTIDLLRPKNSADVMLAPGPATLALGGGEPVIAIGTSTGGTQALEAVLTKLPSGCKGIVIVQHMPARFTGMLAQRLNDLCQIEIREALDGDRVQPGRALIAPGGKHMMLKRSGTQLLVEVVDGPLVNRHRPSVDVLFRSVVRFAGANALGILMTGMGDDGARGLKEMRDGGARTIAQDEASCVVFGMPREAIRLGAAEQTLSLGQIPAAIMAYCRNGNPTV
ncbi:MAG: chemotaxis response regulator protein-glutamate methylesterase [Dokdonella sp.]|nr:MAG: chemotaxis response regulator protein-glutamate methylesterase [Dokdonella sp.]